MTVPNITPKDEVLRLQKLFVDDFNKEIYFAIILKSQSSLIIGKVDFSRVGNSKYFEQDQIRLWVTSQVIVSEAVDRQKGEKATELQYQCFEDLKLKLQKQKYKQIEEQETTLVKQALKSGISRSFGPKKLLPPQDSFIGKDNLVSEWRRLKLDEPNIVIFGCRNDPDKPFYLYVLSNSKNLLTKKQSPIEVEVWQWDNNKNIVFKLESARRQYLEKFISHSEGQGPNDRGYFYEIDSADVNEDGVDDSIHFWNKQPSSFTSSVDSPSRIIFAAGSRGNYVFDLQMYNGELRIYSKDEVKAGRAIGIVNRPFVREVDLISQNFVNVLAMDKVAKWQKITDFS